MAMEKSFTKYEQNCKDWESRAVIAEDKIATAEERANSFEKQYKSLAKKKGMDCKKLIQVYQESEEFLNLIDSHDDKMRSVNMSIGWNNAVSTVYGEYPNVVDRSLFPSP